MNAALRQTLSPARRPCGSLTVRVMGETCVLRCSGALWLPDHGTLVAGDLHLEKGSSYAARGQMLPPYDSAATLVRLADEVTDLAPRTVVLLGDSFHDTGSIPRMAPIDRSRLETLASGVTDWVWLEGNHDRATLDLSLSDPDQALPGRVIETMRIGGLTLVHEPQHGDRPGNAPGEVAGHLHPCARVTAYRRMVRRPCFVTDGRRLILPAFGAYAGGLNVLDPAIADLFTTPPMVAALGRDRVHALGWETLV